MKIISKSFLRKIISPSLWEFLKYYKFRIFKNSNFAANNMDKKLQKYLNYDYGFFVELGANDGFTESNTLSLEIKRLWRGILIEPLPHQFIRCCFYRGREGNQFFCNACVSNKNKKFLKIKYANLMSTIPSDENNLKNIDKHLLSGRNHLIVGTKNMEFAVYTKTLNQILDQSNAPAVIDFMSLDVEGLEMEVLKGINFKKYKFKYMLIECRDFKKTQIFLKKNNYIFLEKLSNKYDYLFKSL
jgi:FkbM family methyltransferase